MSLPKACPTNLVIPASGSILAKLCIHHHLPSLLGPLLVYQSQLVYWPCHEPKSLWTKEPSCGSGVASLRQSAGPPDINQEPLLLAACHLPVTRAFRVIGKTNSNKNVLASPTVHWCCVYVPPIGLTSAGSVQLHINGQQGQAVSQKWHFKHLKNTKRP